MAKDIIIDNGPVNREPKKIGNSNIKFEDDPFFYYYGKPNPNFQPRSEWDGSFYDRTFTRDQIPESCLVELTLGTILQADDIYLGDDNLYHITYLVGHPIEGVFLRRYFRYKHKMTPLEIMEFYAG